MASKPTKSPVPGVKAEARVANGPGNVQFVRSEMVREMPPPVSTQGPVHWIRSNLLSSPTNALLTLLSLYILWIVIPPFLRFVFFNGVFSGEDRAVCATIAQGGARPDDWFGGCWAYVGAYLGQFIYGRYPDTELWRVNVVGILFFGGLIPMLIPAAPFKRENIVFLALVFPVAAFILLTGSHVELNGFLVPDFVMEPGMMRFWIDFLILTAVVAGVVVVIARGQDTDPMPGVKVALAIMAAIAVIVMLFAVSFRLEHVETERFAAFILLTDSHVELNGFLVPDFVMEPGMMRFWIDFLILTAVVAGVVVVIARGQDTDPMPGVKVALAIMAAIAVIIMLFAVPFGLEHVETERWGGLLVTMVIAVTGIAASLPLGIALALGRRSDLPIVKFLSVVFIEFWRGVPLITVLFMSSVMLPLFLPEGVTFDKLLRALIGVALFSAAYMAEVVRGGLQAIPKGQYEGAQALGLTYWQMMRMIVLPQALKLVIPGIVNTFIGLFKDTTLVLIIGLFDFLGQIKSSLSDPTWATPVQSLSAYIFAAFVFWFFCFGMSRYSIYMENRLDTGHR